MRGDVWAASSKDYDCLLFGAPRLVRFLTITGKEFLPSKGTTRPLKPELIDLQRLLSHHKITREQLVDLAILVGTDFNEGLKGVGPKTALRLIREYGSLENLPVEVRERLPQDYEKVRRIFLQPRVTSDYTLGYGGLREEALYEFLCGERDFSRRRVEAVLQRMRRFYSWRRQRPLREWFSEAS
jgi:flap endonuclease-1